MSTCTKSGVCGVALTPEALAKSLVIKHKTTGCYFLNATMVLEEIANCDDYEPAATCGMNLTLEQAIAMVIGLNGCDKPAIQFISFV
jgi:hypothetical protein